MAKEFDGVLLKEQVESGNTVLVDFWSTRCGPCVRLAPTLDKLSSEFNIGKVDIDDHYELAGEYKVSALPTLIWFKGGKEVKRMVGLQSEQALRDVFKEIG